MGVGDTGQPPTPLAANICLPLLSRDTWEMTPTSHSEQHPVPNPGSLSFSITLWTISGNASCILPTGGWKP